MSIKSFVDRKILMIQRRLQYLRTKIEENNVSDKAMLRMCEEAEALLWALDVIGVIKLGGGFNETSSTEGWQPKLSDVTPDKGKH